MREPMNRSHGMIGFDGLMKMACVACETGTCDGLSVEPGTIEGVFGRLCTPIADSDVPDDAALRTLAGKMVEDEAQAENGPATAGTAFLGQFIDHDLTLDATTELNKVAKRADKVTNFRTPRLDLDSVYGSGPEVTPFLYDKSKLILGRGTNQVDGFPNPSPQDVQRNYNGTALIGDPRNDENLFVSQVHAQQFVAKHNALVDEVEHQNPRLSEHDVYVLARRKLTADYHSRILNEFLPQVVNADVLAPLLDAYWRGVNANAEHLPHHGPIEWAKAPDMPVEFSAAAFRFGHSMIRQTYKLNKDFPDISIFGNDSDSVKLVPFTPVLDEHALNMDIFFSENGQMSRPIDTHIPAALVVLPEDIVGNTEVNLALRNMQRAHGTFRIPSGDAMAASFDLPVIDPDTRIAGTTLEGNTPLWYYILSEAEQSDTEPGKLGPLGGLLVAGVLLNLMLRGRKEDAESDEATSAEAIV